MEIFYINLDVRFEPPLKVLASDGSPTRRVCRGFLQEIGCTANDEADMKSLVTSEIKRLERRKGLRIRFERVGVIAKEKVRIEIHEDPEIRQNLLREPDSRGIWYKTGRGYYV